MMWMTLLRLFFEIGFLFAALSSATSIHLDDSSLNFTTPSPDNFTTAFPINFSTYVFPTPQPPYPTYPTRPPFMFTTASVDTTTCLDVSYAIPATQSVYASHVANGLHDIKLLADVQSACFNIWNASHSFNSGFYLTVTVTSDSTKGSYAIQYCRTGANYGSEWCSSGDVDYVCLVQNNDVFNDTLRHVLKLINAKDGFQYGYSTNRSYNFAAEPWYETPNNSWSFQLDVSSDRFYPGHAFVIDYADGKIAAFHTPEEPCDVCVQNQLSAWNGTTIAKGLAVLAPKYTNVTSMQDISSLVVDVFQLWRNTGISLNDANSVPDSIIAYDDYEVYSIVPCSRCVFDCQSASFYLFTASNAFLIGAYDIHVFALASNGSLLDEVHSNYASEYPFQFPQNTHWYTDKIGWSVPDTIDYYDSARSYAWPFVGGVAAVTWGGYEDVCTPVIEDTDICHNVSYAVPAVQAIYSSINSTMYTNLTSVDDVEAACLALINATNQYNDGFYVDLFYGVAATQESYLIKFCYIYPNYRTYGCDSETPYICVATNPAVFKTPFQFVFALQTNFTLNYIGSTNLTYNVSMQPWYSTPSHSWSPVILLNSNATGRAYIVDVPQGVVGAVRVPSEPCDNCTQQSLASWPGPEITIEIGDAIENISYASISTLSDAVVILEAVWNVLEQNNFTLNDSTVDPDVYIVFDNDDFIILRSCFRYPSFCIFPYAVYLYSPSALLDHNIHIFSAVIEESNIADYPNVTLVEQLESNYLLIDTNPLTAQWRENGIGFSDVFYLDDYNPPDRAFAWPFVAGTVALTWSTGLVNACGLFPRRPTTTTTKSPSPSTHVPYNNSTIISTIVGLIGVDVSVFSSPLVSNQFQIVVGSLLSTTTFTPVVVQITGLTAISSARRSTGTAVSYNAYIPITSDPTVVEAAIITATTGSLLTDALKGINPLAFGTLTSTIVESAPVVVTTTAVPFVISNTASSNPLGVGAIIGIVIGVIVGVSIIVVGVIFIVRRRSSVSFSFPERSNDLDALVDHDGSSNSLGSNGTKDAYPMGVVA